jgi:hypothetical protein
MYPPYPQLVLSFMLHALSGCERDSLVLVMCALTSSILLCLA